MNFRRIFFGACSLFIFCACSNDTATKEAEKVAIDTTVTTQPVNVPVDTATRTTIDTTTKPLEIRVEDFLTTSFKKWSIPAASTWDQKWFNKFKKGENTVYKIQADFDGNGKKDAAFILKNRAGQFAIWAFLKTVNTYKPVKIYDIQRLENKPLHVGLGVLPPGSYDDLNSKGPQLQKVTTNNPAIHVIFFETASKAFYYKNDKFLLIQTGD